MGIFDEHHLARCPFAAAELAVPKKIFFCFSFKLEMNLVWELYASSGAPEVQCTHLSSNRSYRKEKHLLARGAGTPQCQKQ